MDETPTLSGVEVVAPPDSPRHMVCAYTFAGRELNGEVILNPEPVCTENMFFDDLVEDVYKIEIIFDDYAEFKDSAEIPFAILVYGCYYCVENIQRYLDEYQFTKDLTQGNPIDLQYDFTTVENAEEVVVEATISKLEIVLEPSDITFTFKVCYARGVNEDFNECYDNKNDFVPLIRKVYRGIRVSITIEDNPSDAENVIVTIVPYGCAEKIKEKETSTTTTMIPTATTPAPCETITNVNYAIYEYSVTHGRPQASNVFVPDVSDLRQGDRCMAFLFMPLIDLLEIEFSADIDINSMTVQVQAFTLSLTEYRISGTAVDTLFDGVGDDTLYILPSQLDKFKRTISLNVCILDIDMDPPRRDPTITMKFKACAHECVMPTTPQTSVETTTGGERTTGTGGKSTTPSGPGETTTGGERTTGGTGGKTTTPSGPGETTTESERTTGGTGGKTTTPSGPGETTTAGERTTGGTGGKTTTPSGPGETTTEGEMTTGGTGGKTTTPSGPVETTTGDGGNEFTTYPSTGGKTTAGEQTTPESVSTTIGGGRTTSDMFTSSPSTGGKTTIGDLTTYSTVSGTTPTEQTTPEPETCQPEYTTVIIDIDDCISDYSLNVSLCKGYCESHTEFIAERGILNDVCECCKPSDTEMKRVQVDCDNTSKKTYEYQSAVTCDCSACVYDSFDKESLPSIENPFPGL
ncbi:uncharacterized protein [Amphiura filiformis]|uniref:uncharacterized protein isoform X3 n=1 Tax=Amphiura filiformis TaxID=82378 RepID=UPI003B223CF8